MKSMNPTLNVIDTEKFSAHLRGRAIRPVERRVLIINFRGSKQEKDLHCPCQLQWFRSGSSLSPKTNGVVGQDNPLPIDPAAKALQN